jgi:4-hydroxy-3-polyprenylbenzoate decarboxylase
MQASLLAAIDKPLPHRVVSSAPCQEVIVAAPSLVDE